MIALRFRDVVQNVDTIDAHKELIDSHGKVMWGWWKKDFEDGDLTNAFVDLADFPCFLIDRSKKRMFEAVVQRFHRGCVHANNVDKIPEYYREQRTNVFGWFEITKITDIAYQADIAVLFDDSTLVFIGKSDQKQELVVQETISGNRILVISDLHFGNDYGFLTPGKQKEIGQRQETLTDCLTTDLTRLGKQNNIAAILVTGDLITAGDWNDESRNQALQELRSLCAELKVDLRRLIILPGNHDIVRYPDGSTVDPVALAVQNQTSYRHEREFRLFVDELTGRPWHEKLQFTTKLSLETADVHFCLLNSCTILATNWTEYGFVGDAGIMAVESLGSVPIERPTYKLLALHHHLLPVTTVAAPNSKGVTLSIDAPKILDAAQVAGIQLALHGHEHQPRISYYSSIALPSVNSYSNLAIISNGSTGARRTRLPGDERNTYCIMEFGSEQAEITMREIRPDGVEGTTLYQGDLGVRAVMPE